MRLIGYIRVSTEEQARDGMSLGTQRERLEGYAASQGHDLVGVEADEGVSGGKPASRRPGLSAALRAIRSRRADGILVLKLDRLGRDALETISLAREAERKGWQIVSVYEPTETRGRKRSASSHMIVGVHALLAEYERHRIAENTLEAMRKLGAERRVRSRIAPFGWVFSGGRWVPDPRDETRWVLSGGELVPDPVEQAIVRQILSLRESGYGKRRIPRMVPDNPRTGRAFTADQIASLLARIARWEQDGIAVLAA